MSTVWPNAQIIDELTSERTFDLVEQVDQWLDLEDALKGARKHTPGRRFRAALAIQVARAISYTRGGPLRLDPAQTVADAFWYLCPPEDR